MEPSYRNPPPLSIAALVVMWIIALTTKKPQLLLFVAMSAFAIVAITLMTSRKVGVGVAANVAANVANRSSGQRLMVSESFGNTTASAASGAASGAATENADYDSDDVSDEDADEGADEGADVKNNVGTQNNADQIENFEPMFAPANVAQTQLNTDRTEKKEEDMLRLEATMDRSSGLLDRNEYQSFRPIKDESVPPPPPKPPKGGLLGVDSHDSHDPMYATIDLSKMAMMESCKNTCAQTCNTQIGSAAAAAPAATAETAEAPIDVR